MTLEIKSDRRNLTFGSGEPAVPHEKAVETVKDLVRLAEIEGLKKVLDEIFEAEYILGYDPCTDIVANALYNADYRKRVEGEWEERIFIIFDTEKVGYRCPKCNTTWDTKTNFCPNCGAKMKGGESE